MLLRAKISEQNIDLPYSNGGSHEVTHIRNSFSDTCIIPSKKKFLETNCNELVVFLDIPLLFEKNLQSNYDFIIRTFVSSKVQKERVLKRKNMTLVKFNQIIKKQTINANIESKCISLDLNTEEDIKILKNKVKNFLEKTLNLKKATD